MCSIGIGADRDQHKRPVAHCYLSDQLLSLVNYSDQPIVNYSDDQAIVNYSDDQPIVNHSDDQAIVRHVYSFSQTYII